MTSFRNGFPRGADLLLWLAGVSFVVGLLLVGYDGIQPDGAPPFPFGWNFRRLIAGSAFIVASAVFLAAAVRPFKS